MAPPIAAQVLGLPAFTVADLLGELSWPTDGVDVGVVETAGGVRSPQADDGDVCDLSAALAPDVVVLVADAGLGTINSIRLTMDALTGGPGAGTAPPVVVALNHFDGGHEIHRRNRAWLTEREGYRIVALPGGESELADLVGPG
jgi:dethiobiotin synthetase